MAPLYNLIQALLECLDDAGAGGEAAPGRIRRAAAAFVEDMDSHNRAIARGFRAVLREASANPAGSADSTGRGHAELIGGEPEVFTRSAGSTVRAALGHAEIKGGEPEVFTHSAGSTVRAALAHCREAGVRLTVHCTESRPLCEGSALARELAGLGIPTTLSTDSLAFSLLRRTQRPVLVVGADAVTAEGVVNKAGTLGLATAARSWGIPCYVLAGSEKFLPDAGPAAGQREQPPEEVLPQAPEGLRVINRYFDTTPLDRVTAVITEEGVLTPEKVGRRLADMTLHPRLREALGRSSGA